MFDIETGPKGRVNIHNVPLFMAHQDRNYNCNEQWLDRCIGDFHSQKAQSLKAGGTMKHAMVPPITLGHTPEDPNAAEPPTIGYVDNLARKGKYLWGSLMGIPGKVFSQLKEGSFPYRSAEVIPSKHRLTNVSLLGGRYPHFALPVMRFSRDGMEIVRYTLGPTERHVGMGSAGFEEQVPTEGFGGYPQEDAMEELDPGMGQEQQVPGSTAFNPSQVGTHMGGYGEMPGQEAAAGAGGADPQMVEMAQQIAPIVAQLIVESQANAPGMMEQGAAYQGDQAQVVRNGQHWVQDPDKYYAQGDQQVLKYDEASDAGKHTDQTADFAEDDSVNMEQDEESTDFGDDEAGKHPEDYTGHKMEDDSMALKSTDVSPEVQRYIRGLETRLAERDQAIERLDTQVAELNKHNIRTAQASKRAMLTSKCKEIAALGYSIGDLERIDRHVSRMMVMRPAEVKNYIEDVLKTAPKVQTTVERHGINDFVMRPGAGTENERYFAENQETLEGMGLDPQALELADVLSGE